MNQSGLITKSIKSIDQQSLNMAVMDAFRHLGIES